MHPSTDPPTSGSTSGDWFRTTHWSVVLAAGDNNSEASQQALQRLCQTYWYPLYVFVRRKGYSPEDAEDSTQAFFERVLEKNYFGQADREKGRFRAFLLASLKHFLSEKRREARAAKRGGGKLLSSLDAASAEERYRLEPADTITPETLYERQWAYTVMGQALIKLREEYVAAGDGKLYELLNELEPGKRSSLTYAAIGQCLGRSESCIKAAAHQLQKRYRELIRAEIAHTVPTVPEINAELRHLLAVIGG